MACLPNSAHNNPVRITEWFVQSVPDFKPVLGWLEFQARHFGIGPGFVGPDGFTGTSTIGIFR
jgi:hypothetical protein